MSLKRQQTPKSWPIKRKGTAWVVKPLSNLKRGIPLLIILRDVLGVAQTRKELKKSIYLKNILLNNKIVRDEKTGVVLFDTITLVPSKKHYKVDLTETGKFKLEEINEKDSQFKISKIIDKKILKGKKTQLNLSDGRNILLDIKCNMEDSLLINLKDKKIEKVIEMKEKAKAIIFEGKHMGKRGIIKKINKEDKSVILDLEGKEKKISNKQIMIIE